MTQNFNSPDFAYNKFYRFADFSYNCIVKILESDELIWKLLKDTTADAWNIPNLTYEEKTSLIYSGQEDSSLYRVFMDTRNDSVFTREECILRISPYKIVPRNRTTGSVIMGMETYAHYKVNTLSNYKTRIGMITQKLIEVFNGTNIDGLGVLYFDYLRDQGDFTTPSGTVPTPGYITYFTTNVG